MILADNFEELEVVAILDILRQAGVCVKTIGLTSGPVNGLHGVRLIPDLTLTDFEPLAQTASINALILPSGRRSLVRLKSDPRLYKVLRTVLVDGGCIAVGIDGESILHPVIDEFSNQAALLENIVLFRQSNQSAQSFANALVQRLASR